MSLRDFKKINIKDYETSRLQDNVANFAGQLINNPLLNGLIISDIDVSTSAVEVAHGLGRKPIGYIIVKSSANVTVYDQTSTTPLTTIKLVGSATATISLYIF